ncbi:MAG: thioredoxin domain-containing protein [Planctomycetota bacterium]
MRWVAMIVVAPLGLSPAFAGPQREPLPTREEILKLPPDGGPEFNRLVFEGSPYLRQHARNPVDWHPWGAAAFERARNEDKPIFLSIGYSTCHWCHVMERESFEDAEVAALLNASFVCVKVDREERPDVDQVYMAVTEAMTGSGGWPMTVVMTPDQKPFFAATYLPKSTSLGLTGMIEILPRLAGAWKSRRSEISERAGQVAAWLGGAMAGDPGAALEAATLEAAVQELASRFDKTDGGFGRAPKFPIPHQVRLLLRWSRRSGEANALAMAEQTLRAMARGGIRDHLGGGFHRYSTDSRWLVPHFEKMLCDQALLALAYVEAFEATRNEEYRAVAKDIFSYVLRDLAAPDGGFFSAEDADSEGEEGRFYVWSRAEILEALGEEEGARFAGQFGVEAEGKSVLHLARPAGSEIARAKAKLLAVRGQRERPSMDDKVMTDWNGLMIAALARGARALDEPTYAEAARRAANFVLGRLSDGEGRLVKRWRTGEGAHAAVLDDYAFLALGLIELYETDFDVRWLAEAIRISDAMVERFWDEKEGGFFLTADDAEELLARPKGAYDGAIPSGNSVAALDLALLGHLTGRPERIELARKVYQAFSGAVARAPSQYSQMMIALNLTVGPAVEIVISGDPGAEDTRALLREVRSRFLPNAVVILRPPGDDPPIAKLAEFVREQKSRDGKATAYVCRDFACRAPVTDAGALGKLLDE